MSSAPTPSACPPSAAEALRPAQRAMLVAAALIALAAAGVATTAVAHGASATGVAAPQTQPAAAR